MDPPSYSYSFDLELWASIGHLTSSHRGGVCEPNMTGHRTVSERRHQANMLFLPIGILAPK